MATGGWGTSSNPFQGGAAYDDLEQPSAAPAATGGSAYGAWGGAAPAPPTAPPPFAVAAAQPAAKKSGFFGRGGSTNAAAPAANSFAAAVAPAAANGSLASREAELARREAAVAQREAALAAGGVEAAGSSEPNFPPCYPVIRHNIAADIPPWNRSMIRFALIVELIIIFAFFYNTLITLIAMLAKVGFEIRWWLVALLSMVLGIPGSWYLWYKSMFGSARTDGSTFSYMKTFLLIFVQIVWCGWMVAAIPGLGSFSAGVFPTIDLFNAGDSKSIAFGILYIINICLWGIAGLGCWVCLGLAVKAYRRADDGRKAYEASYGPYVARGASRT